MITTLLSRGGNRRFFITFLLILSTVFLVWIKAEAQYVSIMAGMTTTAITFWFVQHSPTKSESP